MKKQRKSKHGGKRTGAGKPTTIGAAASVGLRLPPDLLARIDTEADRRGLARSDVMRLALSAGLETLTRDGETTPPSLGPPQAPPGGGRSPRSN